MTFIKLELFQKWKENEFDCFSMFFFLLIKVSKGMKFIGGETAALSRVHEYFWKKVKKHLNWAKQISFILYPFIMFYDWFRRYEKHITYVNEISAFWPIGWRNIQMP